MTNPVLDPHCGWKWRFPTGFGMQWKVCLSGEPLCAEETVVMRLVAAELFWRIRCVS